MNIKLMLLPFVILGLAACSKSSSKGSGNSPQSTLTSEQAQTFTKTLDGLGRVQNNSHQMTQQTETYHAEASMPEDAQNKAVNDFFQKKMQDGACQVTMTGFDDNNPPSQNGTLKLDMTLLVSGQTCPLSASYRVKMDIDFQGAGGSGTFDVKFNITDPDLQKANDITSVDMSGGFNVAVNQSQHTFSMTGNINGVAKSLAKGDIKINLNLNGAGDSNNMSMVSTTTFTYSDFTVELKEVQTKDSHLYYLNGTAISEKEYESYMQRMGILGGGSKDSNGSNGNTQPNKPDHPHHPSKPVDGDPTPMPPSPPPNSPYTQCLLDVSKGHPLWGTDDIRIACLDSENKCVKSFMDAHSLWGAQELHSVCTYLNYPCTMPLANIQKYWAAADLTTACENADADCVATYAQQNLYTSAADLNKLCRRY